MITLVYDNTQTIEVGPDEFPFYVKEETVSLNKKEDELLVSDIPQGPSSKLDSDTVDGIQAVTADKTAPNKLVATDNNGRLPSSTLAAGTVVQVVSTQTGALVSGSTAIPYDDSIPQNTEGTEAMTLSITPSSATNKLKIEAVGIMAGSSTNRLVLALFQDSTADALATAVSVSGSTDNEISIPLLHYMTAGTTASTTFKLRFGASSGNYYLNGQGAARKYGGSLASSLTITEIKV